VERETGWRGQSPRRHSRARSRRAFATLYGEVSFFLFFLNGWRRVDEQISYDCWVASRPTIDTVRAEGRSIPSITVCENNYTNYIYSRVCKKVMRCVCVYIYIYIRAKTKIGYGGAAMSAGCAGRVSHPVF
jgi:hypothetical protein